MTSTEFTVGLDGSRVSSKVLKPPGGGSSDIFGLGSASKPDQPKESDTKSRLFGSDPVNANVVTPRKTASNIFGTDNSASVTHSAKKQYVSRNPITGEGFYPENEKTENSEKENEEEEIKESDKKIEETKSEAPKVIQTSIRIRNPPGGKSSGIF